MKKATLLMCFLFYVLEGFTQLHVVGLFPPANAIDVLPNYELEVYFNEEIVSGTVNNNTFLVRGSISGKITGNVISDDTELLLFIPDNSFHPGEIITVTIVPGIVSYDFNNLFEDFTYQFRVAGGPAPEDPMVFLENEVVTGVNEFTTVGDLDSDGDSDILFLAQSSTIGIGWLENDGSGNFTNQGSINTGNQAKEALIFDKDNDGDVDILCRTGLKVFWLENDGSENFVSSDLPFSSATTGIINSVHYITTDSQDGPAVIIGANNGLFISQQSGGVFQTPTALTTDYVLDIYPADIDSDGDLDITATLLTTSQVVWFDNNGGAFSQATINSLNQPRGVHPIDLDGDGDMDLVSNGDFNKLFWHENNGAQSFTKHQIASNYSTPAYVNAYDFDGDGDNDIVQSATGSTAPVLYVNDGTENFTPRFIVDNETPGAGVLPADLDGDSDLDLLAYDVGSSIYWYENSASPAQLTGANPVANDQSVTVNSNITLTFDKALDAPTVSASNIRILGSQSGLVEGIFSGAGTSEIIFNPSNDFFAGEIVNVSISEGLESGGVSFGGSHFEFRTKTQPAPATPATFESTIISNAGSPSSSYTADIDGDGDLDLVTATGQDVNWHRNDGNASYSIQHVATRALDVNGVTAGDIDLDGDLDFVVVVGDQAILYVNDGGEVFTEIIILDESDELGRIYSSAEIIDFDFDGDQDVLIVDDDGTVPVLLTNDGSLTFIKNQINTGFSTSAFYAKATDLDGDLDLDIVAFSKDRDAVFWIENDGDGSFSYLPSQNSTSFTDPTSMFLADLDEDGDLDIVSSIKGENRIVWLENDGSGDLITHNVDASIGDPESVYVSDVDGDGDLDVVAGSSSSTGFGTLWYDNNGNETFTKREISTVVGDEIVSVLAADMDGDGDSDIIASSVTQGSIILYENEDSSLTVTLSTTANGTTNTAEIPVTIDFGEAVTGFDISDVTVTNGTKSNFVDNGDGSFDLDVTASADGAVNISVGASVTTDGAGNANTASNALEIIYDGTVPTVALTTTADDPTNIAAVPVTVTFSEEIAGFDISDVTVTNGTKSNFVDNGDGSYELEVTASADGAVNISVAASVATDAAGNANTASNALEIIYDGTVPTVALTTTADDPTNTAAIPVTVTFSETVTGFDISDVTVTNGTKSNFVDNGDGSYDLDVTASADGTVNISVAASAATDAAGNENTASNTLEVTYDGTVPTVALTTTADDPTNTAAMPVTVTFSEVVTGFDLSDVSIVNGTGSDFTDNGDGSFELTVTATDDGSVNISVAAGAASDAAGNENTASNALEVTYDGTAPTVVVAESAPEPTNGTLPIPVTITFDEIVTGFELADVTIVNGTGSDFTDNGDGSYDLNVTAIADGQVEISVAAGVSTDAAGNTNEVSNTAAVTFDGTKPTVLVTTTESNPTNNSSIPITVTFSEIVTGFDATDLGLGGISNFTDNGDGSYDFTLTANLDLDFEITVAAGVAFDAAGNSNEASNTLEITYDGTAPTVVLATDADNLTNESAIPVTVTFSETVAGFDLSDVTVTNGTKSDFVDNGDGTYDLTVTASSDGIVSISVLAGVATDAASNENTVSNALEIAYDNSAPTVLITTTANDPTNSIAIPITVTFSEEVTGFDLSDLTVANGNASNFVNNGDGSYEMDVTASADGTVNISVAAGVAIDGATNANTASNALEITYDGTVPTVVIATTADDPTNTATMPITVTFSELVTGFDQSDVSVTNGTKSDFVDNGDGSYDLMVTAVGNGVVSVSVAAGVSEDAAGNVNSASNTVQVTFDDQAPATLLSTNVAAITSSEIIPMTIDFSEEVTGFDQSDVSVTNGTKSDFVDNGDGSFNMTVTAAGEGLVSISIVAGLATDAAGNLNTASNTLEITYDPTSTTVTVSTIVDASVNSPEIPVLVTFSEEVLGFELSDVSVTNGSKADFVDNGDGSYDLTVTATNEGMVSISIAGGVATDVAGNANTASNTIEVNYDNTAPTVVLATTVDDLINTTAIPVSITFSEQVLGFDISDVTVTNGTKSNFIDNGDGSYDVTVTANNDGAVSVFVNSGLAQDEAGNTNIISNTIEVTYDGTAPTVVLATTASDPTNVSVIPVTVTFSEEVAGFDLSDLSVGNGNASNFVDNGDGSYEMDVTATADGTMNISVAAGVATDGATNANTASNVLEITYDGTVPTVVIATTADDPTNTATMPITVTFSELVTGFDQSDVSVTNGTKSDFVDNGDGSYDLTVTATGNGVVSVSVAAGVSEDAAGNANSASNTVQVTFDDQAPATLLSTNVAAITSSEIIPMTIEFSEEVTGFDQSDVSVTNGTKSDFVDNGDGSFSMTVTAVGEGLVSISISSGLATDAAGNLNTASNTLEVTYDPSATTVNVSSGVSGPTNNPDIPVTIAFSESVIGFELSDVTVENGLASNLTDNGDGNYSLTVTVTDNGIVSISIAAGVVTDNAGNENTASNTIEVTYDSESPTVELATNTDDLTNVAAIPVTVTFSESVTGFDLSDVSVENGTASDLIDNGDGSFDFKVTATDNGTVNISVSADVVSDAAGNANSASNTIEVTYDSESPTAALATTSGNPTNVSAIPVTVTFSEEVDGFDMSDVTVTNGTTSDFVDNGDGSYDMIVTATNNGAVSISVDANVALDAAGNGNVASEVLEVQYDASSTTVGITSSASSLTNNPVIPVAITFSEAVTGFDLSDVVVTNGTSSNLVDNGDGSYGITATASSDGLVTVKVLAGAIQNNAGGSNVNSNTLEITYDGISPTVQLSTTSSNPTSTAAIPVVVSFSELVTGFDIADLTIANGTASNFVDNGDGSYGLTVTATGDGVVKISATNGVATDAAGNLNTASNTLEITYNSPNESPVVIAAIGNQTLSIAGNNAETVSINLANHFSDPDGDNLLYTIPNNSNAAVATSEILDSGDLLISAVGEGTTTVSVTASDQSGEAVTITFDVIVEITLSISPEDKINVSYYPNPVNSILHIETDSFKVSGWSIYDLSGRLKEASSEESHDSFDIDVSAYASGSYILKLTNVEGDQVDLRIQVKK